MGRWSSIKRVDAEMKAIIGADIYVAQRHDGPPAPIDDGRIAWCCSSRMKGYRNLYGVSAPEGFYYKPRIDKAFLGCLEGGALSGVSTKLRTRFLVMRKLKARRRIPKIFGKKNFSRAPSITQHAAAGGCEQFRALAKKTGANRRHAKRVYLEPEDREGYDALCIQRGRTLEISSRRRLASLFWHEETITAFADVQAAENTESQTELISTWSSAKTSCRFFRCRKGRRKLRCSANCVFKD